MIKDRIIAWLITGAIRKDGVRRKIVLAKAKSEVDKIMTGKSWYKSKTVWTAVIYAILNAVPPISTAVGHPVEIPPFVFRILEAFGLYSVRDGMGKALTK